MTLKKDGGQLDNGWVDSDDAPELDEKWIEVAYQYRGNQLLKRGYGRDPFKATSTEDGDEQAE